MLKIADFIRDLQNRSRKAGGILIAVDLWLMTLKRWKIRGLSEKEYQKRLSIAGLEGEMQVYAKKCVAVTVDL